MDVIYYYAQLETESYYPILILVVIFFFCQVTLFGLFNSIVELLSCFRCLLARRLALSRYGDNRIGSV
jgi:hypothetical protein